MADEKKSDVVMLVAVERGFHRGRLVEEGKEFAFDRLGADGKQRKLPKWAVLQSEYKPKAKKAFDGDLKPKDAQAASKGKRETLGNDLAG